MGAKTRLDHPTTTQKLPWYDSRSPHTKAYETHVLLNLVNSTVADVSIKEGLGYEAVMGIIDRRVSEKMDLDEFKELESNRLVPSPACRATKVGIAAFPSLSKEGKNRYPHPVCASWKEGAKRLRQS